MIYLLAISAGIFSVAFYPALPSLESYVIRLSLISLVWVAIEYSKLSIMSYARDQVFPSCLTCTAWWR